MTEISDKDLVKNLLEWGRFHRFSLSETARLIGKTRMWASWIKRKIDNGDNVNLRQPTRDSIKELLGIE